MKPVSNVTVLQQLGWRYATKKFDPARTIASEDWKTLEQSLLLTPSSYGLQPWKFIIITDSARRAELRPLTWNQPQVTDCSHFVVFAIRKNVDPALVQKLIDRTSEVRQTPAASIEPYKQMMLGDVVHGPRSLHANEWAARQVYIALGNFMTCAAMLGIDTCPIEGFEPGKYDQVLGLAHRGLAAVVCCAAGYRARDDKYAEMPKVRFKAEDVIERI
ncbi:MAG: NAD(P)H-dependent oxidoreductase [Tepidisphaerales bacterium]